MQWFFERFGPGTLISF